MTTYVVTLADARTCQVEADEVTSRADGSLWFLRAPPKPQPLVPTVIFAARTWTTVLADGAQVVFIGEAKPTSPEKPKPRAL
jgi:hypothetical protein